MNDIKLEIKVQDCIAAADYSDDKCTMTFRKIDVLSQFKFTGKVSSRRNMRAMTKQIVNKLSEESV